MVLISARMNLQKDGALQTNAVRHADANPVIFVFLLIRFNASHIVFLKYVQVKKFSKEINRITFY
jgi:hypothetical protein